MALSLKENSPVRAVLCLAVASRVLVAVLFVLWRHLAVPYDTSAELSLPCLSNASSSSSNWAPPEDHQQQIGQKLGMAIEKTIVWDGVYYVRIAECGYEYEQVHAFLPALPLLMRLLTHTIFHKFIPALGLRATMALSGYVISNFAFVLAAFFLYRLSKHVLGDEKQAFQAVALFCFNPASTFYSSIYSESLFALCSFAGLWSFLNGASWTAVALFSMSTGVRSNGVLHTGFVLFQALHRIYSLIFYQRRLAAVVPVILVALLQSAVILAPFVSFQYYGFTQLCLREAGTSEIRPWCKATVPYLYGFVQRFYWDVGFLKYFQWKQLPNFFLASPMLSLAISAIVTYAYHQPRLFFLLGLADPASTRAKVAFMPPSTESSATNFIESQTLEMEVVLESTATNGLKNTDTLRKRKERREPDTNDHDFRTEASSCGTGFDSPGNICFLIQLCSMIFTAAFVMHVQVATRFLSVSPPIYWYGSYLVDHTTKRKFGTLMWTVFLSYIGIGSLLFINFYPFT